MAEKVKFTALIEQHQGMDAGYILFPYDVKELYGVQGQVKVKALFEGKIEYRGSLVKMGYPLNLLLDQHPEGKKFFDSLSYTDRKEYIRWIETAQKEETRARRIGIFIEKINSRKKFSDK